MLISMNNLLRSLALSVFFSPALVLAQDFEILETYADAYSKTSNGEEIWDFLAVFTVSNGTYAGGIKINGHATIAPSGVPEFKINDFCPEDTPGLPQTCFWINNIIKYKGSSDAKNISNYFKNQDIAKLDQLSWFCTVLATDYDDILTRVTQFSEDPNHIEDRGLAQQLPMFFASERAKYEDLGRECLELVRAAKAVTQAEPTQIAKADFDALVQQVKALKGASKVSEQSADVLSDQLQSVLELLNADRAVLVDLKNTLNELETKISGQSTTPPATLPDMTGVERQLSKQNRALQVLRDDQKTFRATLSLLETSHSIMASDISKLQAQISGIKRVFEAQSDAAKDDTEALRRDLANLKADVAVLKLKLTQLETAPSTVSDTINAVPANSEFAQYARGVLEFEIIKDDRSYAEVKNLNDDPVALWRKSVLLARGTGVEQDYEAAIDLLVTSAEKGYALAQNELGTFYHNGTYYDRNFEQAYYWYDQAAQQGYGQAIANIAGMYAVGQHKQRSLEKSLELREIALAQGHGPSALRLGEEYFYGNPLYAPDCRKGKEYLMRAVDMGVEGSGQKLIKAYNFAVGSRRVNSCAKDIGADMQSIEQVKKLVVFKGLVDLNRRVPSAYHQLGVLPLRKFRGDGRTEALFDTYSNDEILEMIVFLFAEIEYIHQIGGEYAFDPGQVSSLMWAKSTLNGLILENCGWFDNPLIERWILDAFDYNAILGRSDYKTYKPKTSPGRQAFCSKAKQLLDDRVTLSNSRNHSDYYGLLDPRDVLIHLKDYTSAPKL